MKKLIKINDVLVRIPVSRAHIYNLIAEGRFPRQVHLGGFGGFWVEDEVDAWIHIDAADDVNRNSNLGQPGGTPCLADSVMLNQSAF